MKTITTLYLIALCCLTLQAQQRAEVGDKITTIALSDTIAATAIDRTGEVYAITNSGQIQRFDKNGKLNLLFKAERRPTVFDPRDGARLFTYSREDQTYQLLKPSFEPMASYKIDSAFAIQPWLICPSGDHKLWILDNADQSLKKINVKASEVEVEVWVDSTVIGQPEAFEIMREYQNFLFLLNPDQGLLVFNMLGQQIRTIDTGSIAGFNFLGEELYYLQGNTLKLFNLFTAQTREIAIPHGYRQALLTDERMILFTPTTIDVYAFRP